MRTTHRPGAITRAFDARPTIALAATVLACLLGTLGLMACGSATGRKGAAGAAGADGPQAVLSVANESDGNAWVFVFHGAAICTDLAGDMRVWPRTTGELPIRAGQEIAIGVTYTLLVGGTYTHCPMHFSFRPVAGRHYRVNFAKEPGVCRIQVQAEAGEGLESLVFRPQAERRTGQFTGGQCEPAS
jgi:hypothetical protein